MRRKGQQRGSHCAAAMPALQACARCCRRSRTTGLPRSQYPGEAPHGLCRQCGFHRLRARPLACLTDSNALVGLPACPPGHSPAWLPVCPSACLPAWLPACTLADACTPSPCTCKNIWLWRSDSACFACRALARPLASCFQRRHHTFRPSLQGALQDDDSRGGDNRCTSPQRRSYYWRHPLEARHAPGGGTQTWAGNPAFSTIVPQFAR